MKILGIIQARMGSRRLPGKVILPLARKSVIEHIIERLQASSCLQETVLVTSIDDSDRPLRALAGLRGWPVVAGGVEDVLGRFVKAIHKYKPEQIVRITADCPLVDVAGMDLCIQEHLRWNADYTHNCSDTGFETLPDGAALGLGVEVVKAEKLVEIDRLPLQPQHREHVTTLILENPESFKFKRLPARTPKLARSDVRLTLDTREDYLVLRSVFDALYRGNPIDPADAIEWLDAHPDVKSVNRSVKHTRLKAVYKILPEGRLAEQVMDQAVA